MRRADRLFAIVQYLRGRRLTTAAQLAQWLEVSESTVYRDVADLAASGVPIDGEAGVGYRIRAGFDLPPLMFNFDEIDALVIGARFVESWGGPGLAAGARSAPRSPPHCPAKSVLRSSARACSLLVFLSTRNPASDWRCCAARLSTSALPNWITRT